MVLFFYREYAFGMLNPAVCVIVSKNISTNNFLYGIPDAVCGCKPCQALPVTRERKADGRKSTCIYRLEITLIHGTVGYFIGVIVMDKAFFRTSLVIGEENIHKLNNSTVWVFGVGGVGGFVVEALARAGVGHIRAVDMDVVDITNINRQIVATSSTVGNVKVEEMKKHCIDINPSIDFCAIHKKFCAENENEFDFADADYIVDAIDMVTSKILLIEKAIRSGVPIISSMGTGNKKDATKLTVSDIYLTEGDPLARVMRRELKKRGVEKLKVVYSPEKPVEQTFCEEGKTRPVTASVPWVPPVAGFIIAGEVVKDICE